MCCSVRTWHSFAELVHVGWKGYCTHLPGIGIVVHVYSKLIAGMRPYGIVTGQSYCNLHDKLTPSTKNGWQQHDQEVAIMVHHVIGVAPVLRARNLGHGRCIFV